MAVQAWVGLSVLHGGSQIACNAKSVDAPKVSVAELDKTALCDTWRQVLGGVKSVSWSAEIMQDFAASGLDEREFALLGVAAPMSLLPAGATYGSVGYAFDGLALTYTPLQATHGELAMGMLGGNGSGVAVRGACLHPPSTARTSSASGTAIEIGAVAATQRMYGALHVTSTSGTSEQLTVKLQSSATEGGSYTDRVTFTTATDVTYQWSSVAGAVTDTWWRVSWTISGSDTPTFEFAVVAGVGAL